MNKIDLEKAEKYINDKMLIKVEDEQLVQFNYTEFCMFSGAWDEMTLNNRGHIYEKKTGNLICNAMPKFFNFSQLSPEKQKEIVKEQKYILTQKYDGCMGLIYTYNDELRCNSRGSFDSFVTKEMWKIINEKGLENKLKECEYNLVCEVVSPATHILVNYGEREEIILITAYKKNTHEEIDYEGLKELGKAIGLNVVEERKMSFEMLKKWCKEHDWTEEGFVVRLKSGERIKFKSEDYIKIAALKANLNRYTLLKYALSNWEKDWQTLLEEKISILPDEIYDTGKEILKSIKEEFDAEYEKRRKVYIETKDLSDKEIGVKNIEYKSEVFNMRKHQKPDKIILRQMKEKEYKNYKIINGKGE